MRETRFVKKISIICLILIVLLTACDGCIGFVDCYAGKRLNNYDNTKWVSSEPDIWFSVQNYKCIGEANVDGITAEVIVQFDMGNGVSFYPDDYGTDGDKWNSERLFKGNCKFGENKLVVTVTNNEKGFLDDDIKTITFD